MPCPRSPVGCGRMTSGKLHGGGTAPGGVGTGDESEERVGGFVFVGEGNDEREKRGRMERLAVIFMGEEGRFDERWVDLGKGGVVFVPPRAL
eukprot:CAMPEP_0184709238 /NCGR_PEP_ID=MMETSP0314-20130426/433_1 /TAXON_ID=38298 /ORGANISM="Rhodella maculata, Strain CCMP 736" /LENGTH=91 /DNA_ID=CAMNT_0027170911 /DNA_START=60 /DNA_END=336 /DNA_ORIENTATION=-